MIAGLVTKTLARLVVPHLIGDMRHVLPCFMLHFDNQVIPVACV